jgi:hypothetical protein
MTKKIIVAVLGCAVALGLALILAGLQHGGPAVIPPHHHSAVYHRQPATVRPV